MKESLESYSAIYSISLQKDQKKEKETPARTPSIGNWDVHLLVIRMDKVLVVLVSLDCP